MVNNNLKFTIYNCNFSYEAKLRQLAQKQETVGENPLSLLFLRTLSFSGIKKPIIKIAGKLMETWK